MTFRFDRPATRQPVFNLPRVVVVLIGAFVLIQIALLYVLNDAQTSWLLVNFAFVPARYTSGFDLPAIPGSIVWTFVTYAFLHGGWLHLGVNSLWLAAFGSPLAWRFGATRFLLFSAVGAIAGAAVHLLFHGSDAAPLVGASAAISAQMAASIRFLFNPHSGTRDYFAPAMPLLAALRERTTLFFLGSWLVINVITGTLGIGGGGMPIAWEAHIGGLLVGLLLFPLFDPIPRERRPSRS